MAKTKHQSDLLSSGDREFAATRWSLVVQAGRQSSPQARQALESLCRTYWYPLYAYARRRVDDVHDAQDLTQEFFATLLERNALGSADQERGRFRAFLLTAFKHFLSDEWDKARAQRRGGGQPAISLDLEFGEGRYALSPVDYLTPERLYERQWALTLLDHVLQKLRDDYVAKGKERHFDSLKPFLAGQDDVTSYEESAAALGITPVAARVAAHRLRKRYRDILRREIAETVAESDDVDDELARLLATLG